MAKTIEASFKEAATTISKTSPNDPIANSFARYQAFAQLRCSIPSAPPNRTAVPTPSTKPKGSISTAETSSKIPHLVLTKWIDSQGVVRTRNTLNDNTNPSFLSLTRSDVRRFEREMLRALDLLINKDDIREHILLDPDTVEALGYYDSGNYDRFLASVLGNKLVTSDMLIRIGRGPIFDDWMIKKVIFEAVMRSNVDFDKASADNAVAATAHFIANNGMVIGRQGGIGHEQWQSEDEHGLEKYFTQIDTSTTSSGIFTLFNQIILQFGTPANIGSSTVEDLITRAALAYAIILQASTRAVEQLVRDTTAHAAKISLDVSVIFAAITLGGSVVPSPYVSLVVDSVEGVIQTVINNYINQPVTAVNAVASNLNDQFSNYILKPALAGDSVPGLFPGDANSVVGSGSKVGGSGFDASKTGASSATPKLTPAARRRQLGQLFQSKYQDYIGMLDTVHTAMRKI